ncbi:MAG: NADH-quinone oxidoreductase subunit H, partial [Candidatus Eisenbacteria bacterium]
MNLCSMNPLALTDPLLSGDLDLTVVLIVIGKTIAVFALLLVSVLMYIWFLRKVIAGMQNRIGPDRAGPFGLFQ